MFLLLPNVFSKMVVDAVSFLEDTVGIPYFFILGTLFII